MKINSLIVDSSASVTDLCKLGVKYPTDKSPYVVHSGHRHPYTAVYDLLFMPLRYKPIKFAEGGIAENMSMKCWRDYFPYAELHGFEYDSTYLNNALNDNLTNTTYRYMDVNDTDSIANCLELTGGKFDVIIDDMIHDLRRNMLFAHTAYRYLKPGGYLIIEDIFRDVDENLYAESLEPVSSYFSSMTFVITDHINRYSPGWDNDKLLVLCRNEVPC
jgi:SAM-dependent methyltransferase